jgi:hypothetical protein
MKVLGLILLAVGLAALAAAMVFLWGIFQRVSDARKVGTIPFQGAALPRLGALTVSTDRLCQLTAVLHPDIKAYGDPDMKSLRKDYAVDARFRVTDEAGNLLLEETVNAWHTTVSANGLTGAVELSTNSSKFAPPASGKLLVDCGWSRTNTFGRILTAELEVYDTVSDHTKPGIYAALFSISGGLSVLLGAGLLFFRMIRPRIGVAS